MEELNSSNWLLGFASGYAVASGEDWYKGIDANSILLYTDNYCRSHPLEPAAHAIFELANEVERKRRKK